MLLPHEIKRLPGIYIRRDDYNRTGEIIFPSVHAAATTTRQYCLTPYMQSHLGKSVDDRVEFIGGYNLPDAIRRAEKPAEYDERAQRIAAVIDRIMQPVTAAFAENRKAKLITDFAGSRPHPARAAAGCPKSMIYTKRQPKHSITINADASTSIMQTSTQILLRAAGYTAAIAALNAAQKQAKVISSKTMAINSHRFNDLPQSAKGLIRITTIVSNPGEQTPTTNIAAAFLQPLLRGTLFCSYLFFAPPKLISASLAHQSKHPHAEWRNYHRRPGTHSPTNDDKTIQAYITCKSMDHLPDEDTSIIRAAIVGCKTIAEQIKATGNDNGIADILNTAANIIQSQLKQSQLIDEPTTPRRRARQYPRRKYAPQSQTITHQKRGMLL